MRALVIASVSPCKVGARLALKVESDAKVDELGVVSLAALVVLGTRFVRWVRRD
jgi:hypothetical protein